ncbi:hypothetical protein [Brevundimonas subvibrioides]|uniref:hypothetical protein n=1 Tax=Brevundimonas subvibrioides TaxID=74313 RepID=UPI0022B2CA48|nr:hypothetical protein [Brevundimonas subvibrioides]
MSAALFAALALLASPQSVDEPQWISGLILDRDPVAAFLSWDFSSVILRASCREETSVITYYGGGLVRDDTAKTALIVDGVSFEMRHIGPAEYEIDEVGLAALGGGEWIELDAPNEMGEPWHLGRASALKSLVASCRNHAQ